MSNAKRLKPGLILALGLMLILMASEFYFTNKVILPPRKTLGQYVQEQPGTPPSLESLGIRYSSFDVNSFDGTRLSGWYIPGSRKLGVLLMHGHGSNRMQVIKHVSYLHQAGYPLILFDFRGSGGSAGKYSSLGFIEARDVQAVVDFVQKTWGIQKFAGIGFSMGASAGFYWAARDFRAVGLVADSPNTGLVPVTLLRGQRDYPYLPDWFYKLGFGLIRIRLGLPQEALFLKPVVQNQIRFPVLYIQGDQDDLKGTLYAQTLYAVSPLGSQLWKVPGAKHVRSYEIKPQGYRSRVLHYLDCLKY